MVTQICLWLTIIGGLNWGLVGILNFDLVSFIFGNMTILTRTVYAVVALSSIWLAWNEIYKKQM